MFCLLVLAKACQQHSDWQAAVVEITSLAVTALLRQLTCTIISNATLCDKFVHTAALQRLSSCDYCELLRDVVSDGHACATCSHGVPRIFRHVPAVVTCGGRR